MFLVFCVGIIAVLALALGGDLRGLSSVKLRFVWVIFAALAAQILVISLLPDAHSGWAGVAHVLTYAGAVGVVAANWRVPGLLLVGAGTASNGLGIAVNGGTLPATRSAVLAAHFHKHGDGITNSGVLAHPHLLWLGDTFASPGWLPFRDTMSVGDVVILLGVAVLILRVSDARGWGSRRSHAKSPKPSLA